MTGQPTLDPEIEGMQTAAAAGPQVRTGDITPSLEPTHGIGRLLERFGALGILFLAIAVFSLLRPETFPTLINAKAILVSQSVLALLCLGLLIPLAAGEFDLSIGSVMSFCTMALAALTAFQGWNPLVAMAVTLLLGMAIGAISGCLVVYFRINSFIATLGMGTVLAGLTIWISNGQIIGAGMVTMGGLQRGLPPEVLVLGQTRLLEWALPVYLMVIAAAGVWILLSHTQFGRFLHAVGGGREVARLAGLRTNGLVIASFIASAGMAAFAAIVALGLFGSAHPDVGAQYLLPAFAAAFLGATAIQPGRFNVWGAMVAIFLLAVIVAGLQQLGAPFWVSPVFNGLALIVAVGLARSREWRRA
jgi:ribose transport system permease protein